MKFGFNWPNGFLGYVKHCQHVRVQGQRPNNDLNILYS